MDVLSTLFTSPLAQALLGPAATLAGAWIGRGGAGINQTATTHGDNSPVNQTVNPHTWHVVQVSVPDPNPRQPSPQTSQPLIDPDEPLGSVLMLGVLTMLAVATVTWAAATWWAPISVALRLVVVLALFLMGLTWRYWPTGVRGVRRMRASIMLAGGVVLWAVTALSSPVRDEPSLARIYAATRGMRPSDAISKTVDILSMHGVFVYGVRFIGLAVLLAVLSILTMRSLGAVIAEWGTRSSGPNLRRLRLGNRLMGPLSITPTFFGVIWALTLLAVALIHPMTVGLLLDHMDSSVRMSVG